MSGPESEQVTENNEKTVLDDSENAAIRTPELLRVSSGGILIIDQFMLSNRQLLIQLEPLRASLQASYTKELEQQLRQVVERFGGCLVNMPIGDWAVYRDPFELIMLAVPADSKPQAMENERFESLLADRGNIKPVGRVFVDTRCAVFADVSILANKELLEDYRRVRRKPSGEKHGRDLLREAGAAVRYGFHRYGDELGVFQLNDGKGFALWPDVVE